MKLFRAVPQAGYQSDAVYTRQNTPRAPSNVPYVVDNLWEALRPANMPSRRYAVYASPTAELALANASSAGADRSDYLVCELEFTGSVKVAHLQVTDARYHGDVRILQQMVIATLGRDFGTKPAAVRMAVAPLFMPYLSTSDLATLLSVPLVAECLAKAEAVSTFWASAQASPQSGSDGELFLELLDEASYALRPI
jgi:hypothetical protein